MTMSVILVGGGKVGTYLSAFLLTEGHRVQVIEVRREEIPELQAVLQHPQGGVALGSGTDPSVLEAAGICPTTVVAAVNGNDETNPVVTSLARFEFGVPRTIARVNNPKNAWMYNPETTF